MLEGEMKIPWKDSEEHFYDMEQAFLKLGKDALTMNHYDLAEVSKFSATDWKEFITHPKVKKYIDSEFAAIEQSELRKTISDINRSRSVGQAQIISALARRAEGKEDKKEGPTFIYCYIPLNTEQEFADNIVKLDFDPFLTADDKESKVAELIGTMFRDYVKLPDQMTPIIIETCKHLLKEYYGKESTDASTT